MAAHRTLDSRGYGAGLPLPQRLGARGRQSARILFDGNGWVAPRPAGKRLDWYLFLHGHDYKAALAAMLRRLGPGVNSWEPNVNPHRVAVCEKALAVLKASVPEAR